MTKKNRRNNRTIIEATQPEKEGLHPAIIAFLIIFFPFGILYLIARINKFLASKGLQNPSHSSFRKPYKFQKIDSSKTAYDPHAYRPGTALWNSLNRKWPQ